MPHYSQALALACSLLLASPLPAQGWSSIPPDPAWVRSVPDATVLPIPETIAAAETEGAGWLQPNEKCSQIAIECATYFATPAARRCTTTLTGAVMRSGEMVLGGKMQHPDGPSRMWWLPMRPFASATLVVRARSLEHPADTLRFTSTEWSRGLPGGEFYHLTRFSWPRRGQWIVVATSGADWGCFVL